jgi:hypothetical protein|tara:strand:- start:1811 stop:2122 length:312 start_codon:yes stop_codon:yes gene_type:complete
MSDYNVGAILMTGSKHTDSSGRYSGSFSKILVLNLSGSSIDSNQQAIFERIEFGLHAVGGTSTIYNVVGSTTSPIAINAGTYLEGPIAQLKLASGSCLAYKNQ